MVIYLDKNIKMKDTIKHILLVTAMFFCFISLGKSQVSFGVGATYLEDLGLQVRSNIPLDQFDLMPKVSYYFVDNATSLSFELDAAYDFLTLGDENPLYLFTGPALYRFSANGSSDNTFGINLGAGLQISQIYAEIRYSTLFYSNVTGQIGFAAGYMF